MSQHSEWDDDEDDAISEWRAEEEEREAMEDDAPRCLTCGELLVWDDDDEHLDPDSACTGPCR